MIIIAETEASTISIKLEGYLRLIIETAESPEDRRKLEDFVRRYLAAVPRDLMKALRTEELIDEVLGRKTCSG